MKTADAVGVATGAQPTALAARGIPAGRVLGAGAGAGCRAWAEAGDHVAGPFTLYAYDLFAWGYGQRPARP